MTVRIEQMVAMAAAVLVPTLARAAGPYSSAVVADHPMAYWRLGESGGNTAVNEIALAGNGTYLGGFTLGKASALSGDPNPSVGFAGGAMATSDAFGNALFSGKTAVSVELWVKPTAAQAGIHILEYGTDGLSDFSLESSTTAANFYANNTLIGTAPLTVGTYSYLVLAIDGTSGHLYKDGAEIATAAFSGPLASNAGAFFLASRKANQRFASVDLDEVAAYDYALSAEQVRAHFAAAPVAVPEPGMAAATLLPTTLLLRRRR